MKEIRVKITEEEYEAIRQLAEDLSESLTRNYGFKYTVTPAQILTQFVSDLTESERSGGSDERYLAESWYYRSEYNF